MLLPIVDNLRPANTETGPRSIGAVKVLRISVTDRCNYRCVYCMPADGVKWLAREDILTFEEIADVVRAAINIHGIKRFKLTGGEPTVRHGLVDLVRMLKKIPGVEDLSLTTNGQLLTDLARPLQQAGLDRITISIDSLHADRFKQITRTGDLNAVLRGLDACEDVGFLHTKINCVTMRGTNEDEVVDFARLTMDRKLTVRFIEYMPLGDAALIESGNPFKTRVGEDGKISYGTNRIASEEIGPAGGCGAQDRGNVFIPETEVRQRIEAELGKLIPIQRETESGVGPAIPYQIEGAIGRIGFISAMSEPFCSTCNRLRLTATGVLRSCLFEGGEVNLTPVLRNHLNSKTRQQDIAQAMTDCVRLKPEVHSHHGNMQMSRIGG